MTSRSQQRRVKTQKEAFDLDALEKEALAEKETKPFRFVLGGKEWSLPPFGTLDRKAITGVSEDDPESMMSAFREALSEEKYREFDKLPLTIDGLNKLQEAWAEHSGISPGE